MRKISLRLKSDDVDKTDHNNTPSQRPDRPSPSPTPASLNWRSGNVSPRWCCCCGEKRQRGQRQWHTEKQKQKQQSTIKHARFFLASALSLPCSSCRPKKRYVKLTHRRGNSLFIIATISRGRITHHINADWTITSTIFCCVHTSQSTISQGSIISTHAKYCTFAKPLCVNIKDCLSFVA